jgi:hypothetical protein
MKKLFTLLLLLITAIFHSNAQDCEPATITNVEREGTGNRINWTMPAGNEKVEISQGCDFVDSYTGVPEDFGVYHRFTPEDLTTVNGGKLTQVVFVPCRSTWQTEFGHTFTIQIYKGGIWGEPGNRDPGTLLVSQELNNNNLLPRQENTITLETPVTIDASLELWIGYFLTNIDSIQTQDKRSAGMDEGPRKEGFGNVIFDQNQWKTVNEINSSSFRNWHIKGIVQTIEGESVNIYFNDTKIADNVSGTTYFHPNPVGEEHCYEVAVNCFDGEVSPLSNRECIPGVGIETITNYELRITVYPNPAGNELRIRNYELRIIDIEVFDVFGRKVKGEGKKEKGEMVIDISNLSAGVYFIRVMDEKGLSVQKFIKE